MAGEFSTDICEVVLEVKKRGNILSRQQERFADACRQIRRKEENGMSDWRPYLSRPAPSFKGQMTPLPDPPAMIGFFRDGHIACELLT
ncbi:MAG TPA: hypothetical protein VGZ48_12180 [Candidatus Acidoferrales bacterium]|jgi:hypothetical protein|nr:hypothetical protein [Candidatus Acidoferrales bacterium]